MLQNHFGYIFNKIYENTPEQFRKIFFQDSTIKNKDELVKQIHASLFYNKDNF